MFKKIWQGGEKLNDRSTGVNGEGLDSVAYREELRLGVIGTFLESYQTAIKANQAGSAVAATDSKK